MIDEFDIETHIIDNHNNINKIMVLFSGIIGYRSNKNSIISQKNHLIHQSHLSHVQREKIKNSNIEYLNFLNSIEINYMISFDYLKKNNQQENKSKLVF